MQQNIKTTLSESCQSHSLNPYDINKTGWNNTSGFS